MSTIAESNPPTAALTAPRSSPPSDFLRRHWRWALPIAPLIAVLWGPAQWAWVTWSAPDSPQAYQPLVLPGAILLAWVKRRELETVYRATSDGKKGGIWVVLIGAGLMLLAHGTQMASVSAIALIVIIAGIVHYIYGPRMVRALRVPLLFLLAMVPLPGFLVDTPTQALQLGSTKAAAQIMDKMHIETLVEGTSIITKNYTVEVAAACSGVGILLPLIVLTLWLLLMTEGTYGRKLFLLFAGFWIALGVNVLRIATMGLLGQIDGDVANLLHDSNSWLFTALAFYVTYLLARTLGITRLCSSTSA